MPEEKEGEKETKSEGKQKIDLIKWFSELNKDSGKIVGGKGANLGEIFNLKIPVPEGFVVTAQAYDYFIKKAGLNDKIKQILETIEYEDTNQLNEKTTEIRKLIINSELPEDLQEEILESYEHLSINKIELASGSAADILNTAHEPIFVAVRSSATTEDLAEASFAGQQDTYINIKGKEKLLEHIKKCFASLFTSRATYYRNKKGFKHEQASLAVVVQKMINSEKSGVMFSKDPTNKTKDIIIEAVWGLGEGIVSGAITPDNYVVSPSLELKSKTIEDKKIAIRRNSSGETKTFELQEQRSKHQVLTPYEIQKLADFAIKLEDHYKKPQDVEFAIEGEDIYIVQTRPITTIKKQGERKESEIKGEVILTGLAASPGIASGKVKIVENLEDLHKIQKGDVLVTKMTNPDMVVSMQKSTAIVTNEGGMTAHAAIVSREMGLPCFSGDSKILTNKGFMQLEEIHKQIKSKEKLLTLSFNLKTLKTEWKKIKKTSKRKGKTIAISISKNGKVEHDILRTTPEHNFFNLEKRTPKYKEIKEILENNKIVYASLFSPKLNIKYKFNDIKAYLCGAIFSDGYLRIKKDGSASTVFVQKNIQSKKKFIKKVKENFKKIYDYELREVRKDYLYCYKKSITQDLIKNQENISTILLSCDKKSILNYLAGIIDGDGDFTKRGNTIKISLDKKKPQILHSLIIACMRLGIVYRIKTEKNQYRFYLCSKINLLKKYFKRLKVTNTKKVTGDVYLSSKELFSDISVPGRKGIKSFVKHNCLLSKEKIAEKVMPYLKNKQTLKELKKILDSDLRALRVKNLNKFKKEFVFNIEVEKNNNYIVFSEHFSPVIVKNCVVGTRKATEVLKDGDEITVDGYEGKIYSGKTSETKKQEVLPVTATTKTKMKVMVDLPSFAERASKTGLKKVGLTRMEGIIAESGIHPNYFLENSNIEEYENLIYKGIQGISNYFDEMWIRTSDIRSDEYQNLKGAPKEKEANPMLGMHGIRYSIQNPKILKAELKALKRIADDGKTLGILMPQVISVQELKKVKEYIKEIGFEKLKVGIMIETPAAVQLIKDFCEEKIDFISFGTNDLTQYMLAIDRGNQQVQHLYDEMHPAILYQLAYVIRICKKYNVETSICGQAGSKKEMVKFLVEHQIDSISVNADIAKEIADYVQELEETVLKGTDKEPRQYELKKQEEETEKNVQEVKAETPKQNKEEEEIIEEQKKETPEEKQERIEKDIQAIEQEKQEYLKEHPEENSSGESEDEETEEIEEEESDDEEPEKSQEESDEDPLGIF